MSVGWLAGRKAEWQLCWLAGRQAGSQAGSLALRQSRAFPHVPVFILSVMFSN